MRLTKCDVSLAVQGAVGSITRCNCHDENEGATVAVIFNLSHPICRDENIPEAFQEIENINPVERESIR